MKEGAVMGYICCPICKREYSFNIKTCECGFDGLVYMPYEAGERQSELQSIQDFNVYKYAKAVLYGEIPFEVSGAFTRVHRGKLFIDSVDTRMGIALVDGSYGEEGRETVADMGILAFDPAVTALILNTDYVHTEFLDESSVVSLLFGKRVREFKDGHFVARSRLRYITVHGDNPYFCSENNVLFTKDMSRLVFYAPWRPEEIYCVPRSVRVLGKNCFYLTRSLKRLILPEDIEIEDGAFKFFADNVPDIAYY